MRSFIRCLRPSSRCRNPAYGIASHDPLAHGPASNLRLIKVKQHEWSETKAGDRSHYCGCRDIKETISPATCRDHLVDDMKQNFFDPRSTEW
jgi:hypothetical protein